MTKAKKPTQTLKPSIFERWAKLDKPARAGWFAERFDPSLDRATEFLSLYRGEVYTDENGIKRVSICAADGVKIKNGTFQKIVNDWKAWSDSEENDTEESTASQWFKILWNYRDDVLRGANK